MTPKKKKKQQQAEVHSCVVRDIAHLHSVAQHAPLTLPLVFDHPARACPAVDSSGAASSCLSGPSTNIDNSRATRTIGSARSFPQAKRGGDQPPVKVTSHPAAFSVAARVDLSLKNRIGPWLVDLSLKTVPNAFLKNYREEIRN
jgi:hypothetical protein